MKKIIYAMLVIISIASAFAATPELGHSANSIGPGKFSGNSTDIWTFPGKIQIMGGSPGENKVLISDAFGLATWEEPKPGPQGEVGPQGPKGENGSQGPQGWQGMPGGVQGQGRGYINYIPKWTPDASTLGNSIMRDDGTNVGIGVDPAGYKLRVYGPVRGSSFTDEENTGYYVDPASTSSMNAVYTNALYYSNIYLNGNSAYGFKGSSVYADTINTGSSGNPLELNYVNSGPVTTADMRADIFYDRSNTAYYVDPDGNTRLAGNVGIGTAPGSWKLQAVGGAYGIAGYGTNTGVLGHSYDNNGVGVKGFVYGYYSKGVYGYSTYGDAYGSYAGYFQGDVKITGKLLPAYLNCQDIAVPLGRVACPDPSMVVRGVVTGSDGDIPDTITLICCN